MGPAREAPSSRWTTSAARAPKPARCPAPAGDPRDDRRAGLPGRPRRAHDGRRSPSRDSGISADYGLPPTPNTSLPDPLAKSTESLAYSKAGVDSGEIIIRGGSHLDFSFIPNQAFGASLRGADVIAWYTTAWFDKYLKQAPADTRLLTNRWREDPIEAAIDPKHDGNAFSFYYLSRLDVHLAGGQALGLRGPARRAARE